MYKALIQNEFIKLKSTLALWMMLLMPMAIVLLTSLLMLNKPSTTMVSGQHFASQSLAFWLLLIQPMYLAIVGVLLLQIEHESHGWQRLYVLPASRFAFYFSKALVMLVLQIGAVICLAILTGLSLFVLSWSGHLTLSDFLLTHYISAMMKGVVAGLVLLSLQHWLSTRWPSIVVPLIVAVAGSLTIPSVTQSEKYWLYDPWTYGMIASMASDKSAQWLALSLSVALALLIFALGSWDIAKRELR